MINDLFKIMDITESINNNITNILFDRLIHDLPNHDINSTQTLIIYRIGNLNTPHRIGKLIDLRCYWGTNISYNLNKLKEKGYVTRYKSSDDERIINIGLTKKGMELHAIIKNIFDKEYQAMKKEDLSQLTEDLASFDAYLIDRCFLVKMDR